MTTTARRLLAFFGPTVAGAAVGIERAFYGGGGRVVLGVLLGAAAGVTLVAFVPEDRSSS